MKDVVTSENKASAVIKKIMDVVTIVGPAVVSVVGIVSAAGAHWADTVVEIVMIALGAASSIASLIYNAVNGGQS